MKRLRIWFFALALLFGCVAVGYAAEANFDSLSISFPLNGQWRDETENFGLLYALNIAGFELNRDLVATVPGGKTFKMAAVLSAAYWSLGANDPIVLDFVVSTLNAQRLNELMLKDLGQAAVTLTFEVWAYDPAADQYYPALVGTTLKARLQTKTGSSFLLNRVPNDSVRSPQVYDVRLIIEATAAQTLAVQTGVGRQFLRQWGVAVR